MVRKQNKALYYIRNIARQLVPGAFYRALRQKKQGEKGLYSEAEISERVSYYNKLQKPAAIGEDAFRLRDMPVFKSPKAYGFDTYEYTRYFDPGLKINLYRGDITWTQPVPTIQKSRPVSGDNANAVLLNLDKARHFVFVNDKKPFREKKDLLIGRGAMTQSHRVRFMERYFGHPLCDLGHVGKPGLHDAWLKPRLSIPQHLDYKFILSLEGHDVATNLKWILSSNSVAVMPEPKFETWFMEGRLVADQHYIRIREDYADLEERIRHFLDHPEKAEAIVHNANAWVRQFFDPKKEDLIALLVLEKYFRLTQER
ncbi:MAG: lipopolysaccharide biosynthesis protein [Mucilaginibacter polytrichastri]|nr:lipopolysaccharide biosynthesis protein [Mucilaginibacter polytrichastri]